MQLSVGALSTNVSRKRDQNATAPSQFCSSNWLRLLTCALSVAVGCDPSLAGLFSIWKLGPLRPPPPIATNRQRTRFLPRLHRLGSSDAKPFRTWLEKFRTVEQGVSTTSAAVCSLAMSFHIGRAQTLFALVYRSELDFDRVNLDRFEGGMISLLPWLL